LQVVLRPLHADCFKENTVTQFGLQALFTDDVQKSILQYIEKVVVRVDSHAVLVDFLYAVYLLLKTDPSIKRNLVVKNRAFEVVLNVRLSHTFICHC
jgi:hypothetical protein